MAQGSSVTLGIKKLPIQDFTTVNAAIDWLISKGLINNICHQHWYLRESLVSGSRSRGFEEPAAARGDADPIGSVNCRQYNTLKTDTRGR